MNIQEFTFNDWNEKTYVLYDENKQGCILDPGCFTAVEEEQLFSFIAREHIQIEKILITHGHHDHIFGLYESLARFPVPSYGHRGALSVLALFPKIMETYGVHVMKYPPNKFHSYLDDGDTITVGSLSFRVLHTPGHSPGSISLYAAADKFVFTGDILFTNSVGRTDIAFGDYDLLIASIKHLYEELPSETVYLPGHGDGRSLAKEKQENPYLRF